MGIFADTLTAVATMIKAVFFDMDGVLYDSMPNHEYSWRKAFEAEGITFRPEEAYANEGRTARGTINLVFNRELGHAATDEDVERIYAYKTSLMRSRPQPPLLPRMRELLLSLPSLGVKVFVVTGSRQPSLVGKLHDAFGIGQDTLVCGADVKRGKPDPEPYLMALERSGFAASECLVVENAPLGIISGKAAGLTVWAVNTGKLPDSALTGAGADRLFHTTTELAAELIATVTAQRATAAHARQ